MADTPNAAEPDPPPAGPDPGRLASAASMPEWEGDPPFPGSGPLQRPERAEVVPFQPLPREAEALEDRETG